MYRFEHDVGELVVSVAFFAALVWLGVRSPLFTWLVKLLLLSLWLVCTEGAALFVALVIHFPHGHYVAGTITILLGGALAIPWFAVGWPELRKMFPPHAKDVAFWS